MPLSKSNLKDAGRLFPTARTSVSILEIADRFPPFSQKQDARSGQPDASRGSFKQFGIQLAFQRSNKSRQRRLRHPENLSAFSKV